MDRHHPLSRHAPRLIALAAAMAMTATVRAQADATPATPASPAPSASSASSASSGSVSIGAGVVSGDRADRALFGQYNGLRTHGAVGLFGFEYARRDDDAGTSYRLEGSDQLGQSRALDLRWAR